MFKEMIFIKIKGKEIPLEIKRYKKSRGLKLMGVGSNLRVTTALDISKTRIKEILKPYRERIYTLYSFGIEEEIKEQKKKDNLEVLAYIEGFRFEIVYDPIAGPKDKPKLDNRKIILKENLKYNDIYQQLDEFFFALAQEFLPIYFETLLPLFTTPTKPELRIKKMIRQWGNCKQHGSVITLNSHLIKLPSELINYIIFHELAHLVEPNHSKDFYKIIEHRYPDRKELDQKLKKWSFVLKDNYIEEYQGEESS